MTTKQLVKLSNQPYKLFNSDGTPHRLPTVPDDPVVHAVHLWRICKAIHKMEIPYVYGGGHTISRFEDWAPSYIRRGLDCSASVGFACWLARMPEMDDTVSVSGVMEHEFRAGNGNLVTLNASNVHAWLSFNIKRMFGWKSIIRHPWRYDTSAWGDASGSGPRMRKLWRSNRSFVKRHPKGL